MVEEEIEDIQPSQLVDTNTTPKLRHKLLPRRRLANTLNQVMVNNREVINKDNNQEDINKDKAKENGPLNNLLKRTTSPDNITRVQIKVRMEMEVTE